MATLKNNWLLAGISLIILLFGFFIVVSAVETDKEVKKATTVTVYFNGDPTNPDHVADEARWSEDNPAQNCLNGTQLACSMDVEDTDLNPSTGELDPAKISLNASPTASGYIPVKAGGTGSDPTIRNRN